MYGTYLSSGNNRYAYIHQYVVRIYTIKTYFCACIHQYIVLILTLIHSQINGRLRLWMKHIYQVEMIGMHTYINILGKQCENSRYEYIHEYISETM